MNFDREFSEASAIKDAGLRRRTLESLLDAYVAAGGDGDAVASRMRQVLSEESDHGIMQEVWERLGRLPAGEGLKDLAADETRHNDPGHREGALRYLARTCPEDLDRLYQRMIRDPDPFVLTVLGDEIRNHDPAKAVEAWRAALPLAPMGLADEVLPANIGQYASPQVVKELEDEAPDYPLAAIAVWNAYRWMSVEYLDAKGPVPPGAGYEIACPSCSRPIGIRQGHSGERVRHLRCGATFKVPPPP